MKLLRCPVCNKPVFPEETKSMPFCSERCRSIDLNRWFGEEYGLLQMPEDESHELPDDKNESGDT